MSRKLRISGIAASTSPYGVVGFFAGIGHVKEVLLHPPGPRGETRHGLVEMATEAGREAALRRLDGATLEGRTIRLARVDHTGRMEDRDRRRRRPAAVRLVAG